MTVISLFRSTRPPTISKRFRLSDEGELIKEPGGAMTRGVVERVVLDGPEDLASLLLRLGPANALAYGVCPADKADVVLKAQVKNGQVARSRQYFSWPDGPGILMLDCDEVGRDLPALCPSVADAPAVLVSSASTHIYHEEKCLLGEGGARLLVFVADARDIPRAGEVLFRRLWLDGHGSVVLSVSGRKLLRAPIDLSVFQPERLDFVSGAAVEEPLVQRRPRPIVRNNEAALLDTRKAIPPLSDEDVGRYEVLVEKAKNDIEPEARLRRSAWVEARVAEHPPEKAAMIREIYTKACEKGILLGDFVLHHESGPVTVGEMLDDVSRWHNVYIADPLEPDYHNSKRVAWVNLRAAGRPYIYSHAHGGIRYRLERARGEIRVDLGERREAVRRALELLKVDGQLFERSDGLVHIDDGGTPRVADVERLSMVLDGLVRWTRFDKRSESWRPIDCPYVIPKGILAWRGGWHLPQLIASASAPYLDPKTGHICETDGYDERTGILLQFSGLSKWAPVPKHPTPEQVKEALESLWFPFEKFPFCTELDRSVWLACLLTAAIRSALPTAPAFAITAPGAGTGKTLLAKCAAAIAGMEIPGPMTMSREEEENRKSLFALGREAVAAILVDNIDVTVHSASMASWLTDSVYRGRVLGESRSDVVPTRALFMLTGINIGVEGDLCRRILTVRIDPEMEAPWSREFELDPHWYCRENRLELVRAALIVLRAAVRGAPPEMEGRTASYEQWSDTVRRAVVCSGYPDPTDAISLSYTDDPETERLGAILGAWSDVFGETPVSAAEAVDKARQVPGGNLYSAIEGVALVRGDLSAKSLGRWIMRRKGRIVDGLHFHDMGIRAHVRVWKVGS